jgi:hypothetical protein
MPRSWAMSPHACIDDSGPKKHSLTRYVGPSYELRPLLQPWNRVSPQSRHAEHLHVLARSTLQSLDQIRVFGKIERAVVPGEEGVHSLASILHPFPEWDQTVTKKISQSYRPEYPC